MKKVLCLALVLTMVCALLTFMPATAATIVESGECGAQGDNVKWTLDSDGTLTISGTGDTIDIRDGQGFPLWSADKVKKVIIQEGVTSIADEMFDIFYNKMSPSSPDYDYPNLTEIIIPNSVRSIGYRAFRGCTKLAHIDFPDTLTEIKNEVFYNTALYNDQSNWTNGVLYVGKYLIEANPDLVKGKCEVKLGTLGIAVGGFYDCVNLTNLVLPNSLKYINDNAFDDCTGLSEINLPDSVISIGEASYGSLFYDTAYYKNEQNWTNGVLYIDNHLIKASSDELASSYQIRQGTKTIASQAFISCKNLENITIPDSMVIIGSDAFEYCYKLTNINIPNNVKTIGEGAFVYCESLASINLPNSIAEIGEEAFYRCALTSITIPNSVTEIKRGTFNYCGNLKSVYVPKSVEKIGYFEGCDNLADVYYEGSKNEWDLISIVYNEGYYGDSSSLLNANIHYNSPMPSEATPTPKPTPISTPTPTPKPTVTPTSVPTAKPTADPSAPSVEITEVWGEFVTVKVNNCDDPFAQVILAVYNKNGALIDMQQSYNFGEVIFLSENLQNADIKVMLWSDTDNIKPLAEIAEMSL